VTGIDLDGDPYLRAYGVGLTHERVMGQRLRATASAAIERREIENSAQRPRADQRSADHRFGALAIHGDTAAGLFYSARFGVEHAKARAAFESYSRGQFGADMGMPLNDFRTAAGPLRVDLGVTYRVTDYDAPDPLVTTRTARSEQRWAVAAGLEMPIAARTVLSLRAERSENRSNLPNYRYADTYAAVVVRTAFGL
jgi:hypothetical protein